MVYLKISSAIAKDSLFPCDIARYLLRFASNSCSCIESRSWCSAICSRKMACMCLRSAAQQPQGLFGGIRRILPYLFRTSQTGSRSVDAPRLESDIHFGESCRVALYSDFLKYP